MILNPSIRVLMCIFYYLYLDDLISNIRYEMFVELSEYRYSDLYSVSIDRLQSSLALELLELNIEANFEFSILILLQAILEEEGFTNLEPLEIPPGFPSPSNITFSQAFTSIAYRNSIGNGVKSALKMQSLDFDNLATSKPVSVIIDSYIPSNLNAETRKLVENKIQEKFLEAIQKFQTTKWTDNL